MNKNRNYTVLDSNKIANRVKKLKDLLQPIVTDNK